MTEIGLDQTRNPHRDFRLGRALAASAAASLAFAASQPSTVQAEAARGSGISDCIPYFDIFKYHDHEYEVCTAYTLNSAEIALQGFYKFGNSRVSYIADGAKHHFETRYFGGPRRAIERQVSSWPKTSSLTGNKVENNIRVMSVSSSLPADRGLLKTRESWNISAPDGKTLYKELPHNKDVTMCRGKLPGHILHAWFVVKFSNDPNFNCIVFDKNHGLKP